MIVEPKVKGFICTTAHPVGGEENVRRQIAYCKEKGQIDGPKKVLVIGGSTGYGLASRIAVTYGYGADTISVAFEKEAKGKRTASAGWYNTKAFEKLAKEDGYYAKSFNGDGFSAEMKQQVIEAIKEVCAAQSDYSWVVNGRFKGGYITRAYGQPQQGVQAVQLELAQLNYMDETPPFAWQQDRATQLQKVLKPMMQAFLQSGKPR